MALYRLTHLVVNNGQLGANWYPIGTQLAPNWVANGNPVATHFLSTMAKNGFLIGNKWLA